MNPANIFESIPDSFEDELVELLVQHDDVKIERIVSRGHSSPTSGWYDQERNEWVIVLKGAARITLEGEQELYLEAGNHLSIPAHTRHKVTWTKEDTETIWLAVHY
jgi:cupin 2 domain-containing protein